MQFFKKSRSRSDTSAGHMIITGTGRAGTTLLVQYFTILGFDTGFSTEESENSVDPVSNAGLEHSLASDGLPYVIKSPWFADQLADVLAKGEISVRHAILPVRSLFEAAESRRRVSSLGSKDGGLWGTDRPGDQETVLAHKFYNAVFSLVSHDVPITFLQFPKLAKDFDHFYQALGDLLLEHGVHKREAKDAFDAVTKPDRIHQFGV